ncbi:aquaporin-4 [Hyalella azteca]|uniref:Aquaporin-4 n=1 Tax=Hyalella azteca TaxID=294128 RepID=A0A8B7P0V8_HYAAZ|nr:aquaporin-4 [Hyalella azteca]
MGCTRVNPELTEGQAFGVEVLCTFLLVFTIFGSTDSRRTDVKGSISLAIGLAAICTHMFGIPYTGSSLNPARTFGPALVVGGDAWDHHWLYWMAPPVGGMTAGLLYSHFFRQIKERDVEVVYSKHEIQLNAIN